MKNVLYNEDKQISNFKKIKEHSVLQTKDLVTFQLKAARRALNLTLKDVFESTGISVSSLHRLEAADLYTFPKHTNILIVNKLRHFLEEKGIEFLASNCVRIVPKEEQMIIRIKN